MFKNRQHNFIFISLVLLLALIAIFMQDSFAQTMPTLEEIEAAGKRKGDQSREILTSLLGGNEGFGNSPLTAIGPATGLLGNLFFVFNAVLFVIGTGYIFYTMIVAVVVSANEGEVLGKRMSGVWIPIRMGLGVFGMIPVFSGFSLAQAVMLSVAFMGIGLANMLVETAVKQTADGQGIIDPPSIATVVHGLNLDLDLAKHIFVSSVCVDAYEIHNSLAASSGDLSSLDILGHSGAGAIEHTENQETISKHGGTGEKIRITNNGIETVGYGNNCGGVTVLQLDVREGAGTDVYSSANSAGFRNSAVDYDAISLVARSTYHSNIEALHSMFKEIRPIAQEWYKSYLDSDGRVSPFPEEKMIDIYMEAKKKQKEVINEAVKGAENTQALSKKIQDAILERGWLGLGSWYSTFAEANAALQTAALSTTFKLKPVIYDRNMPDSVSDTLPVLVEVINNSEDACLFNSVNKNVTGHCSPMQNGIVAVLEGLAFNTGGKGMVNPIITAKNIGDWMLLVAGAFITIKVGSKIMDLVSKSPLGVVSSAAAKVAGGAVSKGLGNIIADAGGLGLVAMLVFLTLGITFAVYIPFIPFITWLTALISYFVSVIEGLIAAQVWAFSHINMDQNDGLGSKSEKGYFFILNMLLRPGLMVLGFFFASAILTLMGTFLFQQIGPAIANVQGDTMSGLLIFLGIIIVVMIMLIAMIQAVFDMVYEVPDKVIAWFGHGMEARSAQKMDNVIQSKADAASRWTSRAAMGQSV